MKNLFSLFGYSRYSIRVQDFGSVGQWTNGINANLPKARYWSRVVGTLHDLDTDLYKIQISHELAYKDFKSETWSEDVEKSLQNIRDRR